MKTLNVDIETYSSAKLPQTGTYKYVEAEDFDILLIAYSIDGGAVTCIDMLDLDNHKFHLAFETFKIALFDKDVKKIAFNANFERTCLAKYFEREMPPEEWQCTMVNATRVGLPASLEMCGQVLKLDTQKDRKGKALISYFSQPCKPTKVNGGRTRNLPKHATDKWQDFMDYCVRDVEVEMAIADKISVFEVTPFEQHLWSLDQKINDRGIHVDEALMLGAVELDKISKEQLMQEAVKVTGLENPNSPTQLLKWLNDEGLEIPNLQKATVEEYAKVAEGKAKKMLELRLQLAKTSVKKYTKMEQMMCSDHRIRGAFQFYGAGTGRWAGRGIQLQNLTKHHITDTELKIARDALETQDFETLGLLLDETQQDLLSQLVRTTFTAEKGNTFAVSDFSAIEARVIAWYANETWRLRVFETHGKIYEASASQMFNVPIEEIGKGNPLRQKGKVAELALGYQGGAGALKAMGALKMGLQEDELKPLVDSWREANPRIVQFWYAVQNAAIDAIKTRRAQNSHGLTFRMFKGALQIILPSGRALNYLKPHIEQNSWGADTIVFKGQDSVSRKWCDIETYGGKLVENIVQATARDVLAVTLDRLDKHNFNVVAHVHDEVIVEVPKSKHALSTIEDLMNMPVDWAEGLPLNCAGFESDFYMKD